ncbi:MAG: ABC transporter ATP-binding protein/permease [Proteobacteria bacterium]|nr:ABC transporter ATP-binding protein/permease [Pseudomonadota bacterium]
MAHEAEPRLEIHKLKRLGDGSENDRLRFRLILGLLRRCLHLLWPVKWHVVCLLLGFAVLAVGLLFPTLLLIDTLWTRVLQGESLLELHAAIFGLDPATWVHVDALQPEQRSALVRQAIWIGIGVTLVALPGLLGLYYWLVWILQRVNQLLRLQLLDRLQALSLRFHSDNPVGDALYRLYQDSSVVTQLVQVLIMNPLAAIARYAFALSVVGILYDPALAAVLALAWPPTLWLGAALARRMRVGFRRARESNAELMSRIQETLVGIRVIKAYGAETVEQERFETSSATAFEAAYSARNLFASFQVAIFAIVGTAAIAAIALGTLQARDAELLFVAVGGFTAWNLGLYNFFKAQSSDTGDALREIYRTWGRLQDIGIGLDRVFEVLDLEPEVQDAPDARDLSGIGDGVRFENVHFGYLPEAPVLQGIDLAAPTGTITAIVGPTGSGKSTLMALLLRLYEPDTGRIEIDGHDLRGLTTASLRDHASIALQENVLFGASVRENLRYAAPDASDAQVEAAARVACAHEFIERLPQGYDTLLGERGTKLSTGQRQRLSIARALVKDAPILVLDEPTAALDAETELRVLANLSAWGRGRCIFLITHRLSTIRRADQIAFLVDGRVAEMGSHDDLMGRAEGAYRRLVEAELGPAREPREDVA